MRSRREIFFKIYTTYCTIATHGGQIGLHPTPHILYMHNFDQFNPPALHKLIKGYRYAKRNSKPTSHQETTALLRGVANIGKTVSRLLWCNQNPLALAFTWHSVPTPNGDETAAGFRIAQTQTAGQELQIKAEVVKYETNFIITTETAKFWVPTNRRRSGCGVVRSSFGMRRQVTPKGSLDVSFLAGLHHHPPDSSILSQKIRRRKKMHHLPPCLTFSPISHIWLHVDCYASSCNTSCCQYLAIIRNM
jgi:hypothetical protein